MRADMTGVQNYLVKFWEYQVIIRFDNGFIRISSLKFVKMLAQVIIFASTIMVLFFAIQMFAALVMSFVKLVGLLMRAIAGLLAIGLLIDHELTTDFISFFLSRVMNATYALAEIFLVSLG